MADISQEDIKRAFLAALKDYGAAKESGAARPTGASPSGPTDQTKKDFSLLGESAKAVGGTFLDVGGKIAQGGARFSDATKAIAENFSKLGGQGSVLGSSFAKGTELLNKLGQNIDQNIDVWRSLSDTGASFNNDVFAMKDAASNARMSIEEMADVTRRNSTNLAGLGSTVGQSVKAFSTFSNSFFESGAGEGLRAMGYSTKELNDVLAVSISTNKLKDLQTKEGQDRAINAAKALATEMDEVAKITGKSKQEQLDELRRKQADGQRQAAIDSAIAKGGENAKAAFDTLTTTSGAGGKSFQKLAEDIASMGRPSEGMEGAYAALGSQAQKLLAEAGAAARAGNQELAKQRVQEAMEARANFQKTETYRTLAAQGVKEFSDSYGEGGAFRRSMDAAGGSVKDLAKDVKDAQAGIDKETGKESPTAAITRFAVDVESRGRDLTKTLNDQVIQPLAKDVAPKIKDLSTSLQLSNASLVKDKLGEPMERERVKSRAPRVIADEIKSQGITEKDTAFKDIEKLVGLSKGPAADATAQALNKIAASTGIKAEDVIQKAMANKGAGVAELNKQIQAAMPEPVRKIQEAKDSGQAVPASAERAANRAAGIEPTGLPGLAAKGIEGFGDLFRNEPGKVEVTNFPTRHEGTMGKTGQLFEPTDFFGIMKKGETMFTPDQLTKFAMSSKGAGIEESMSALGQTMKSTSTPSVDLSAITGQFSNIFSTSLSSASESRSEPFDFNQLVTQLSSDISDAIPLDLGFDNLEDSISGVADTMYSEFDDLGSMMSRVSNDIDTEFGDLSGAMKRVSEDMYPDTEFGDLDSAIRQQQNTSGMDVRSEDGSIAQGLKINPETGETYSTELPTANIDSKESFKMPSMNDISFGPNGMPIFKQLDSAKQTIPPSQNNPEIKQAKKEAEAKNPEAADDTKPKSAANLSDKATLSDVVTAINQLNIKMAQLISQNEDIGNKQVRAVKGNSSNLYAR